MKNPVIVEGVETYKGNFINEEQKRICRKYRENKFLVKNRNISARKIHLEIVKPKEQITGTIKVSKYNRLIWSWIPPQQ